MPPPPIVGDKSPTVLLSTQCRADSPSGSCASRKLDVGGQGGGNRRTRASQSMARFRCRHGGFGPGGLHKSEAKTAPSGERPDSIRTGPTLRCLLAHETCARSATGNRLEFAHVNRHFSCRFLRIAVVEHARLAGWCIYNVVGFAKYPFLDTPASACWGRGEGRAQRVYRGRLTPPQHARHPCCLLAEFMPSLLLFRLRPSNAPSEAWQIRRC